MFSSMETRLGVTDARRWARLVALGGSTSKFAYIRECSALLRRARWGVSRDIDDFGRYDFMCLRLCLTRHISQTSTISNATQSQCSDWCRVAPWNCSRLCFAGSGSTRICSRMQIRSSLSTAICSRIRFRGSLSSAICSPSRKSGESRATGPWSTFEGKLCSREIERSTFGGKLRRREIERSTFGVKLRRREIERSTFGERSDGAKSKGRPWESGYARGKPKGRPLAERSARAYCTARFEPQSFQRPILPTRIDNVDGAALTSISRFVLRATRGRFRLCD